MGTDLEYNETYMNSPTRFDSTPKWFTARSIYTTIPDNPKQGDVWYDEPHNQLNEYNGSSWSVLSGGGGGGSTTLSVVKKTSNYTLTTSNDVILVDATAGTFTITIPTAVGALKEYQILSITAGTNIVTVAASGGQQINGAASTTIGSLASTAPYTAIGLVSDNANWWII